MATEITQFSKQLFWDVNPDEIDLEKHRKFIVQRVLERGRDSDWERLKACYTISGIVESAQQLRSLEPSALAFIACVGNVKKESFRCYTWRQSNPTHWTW